MKKFIQKMKDPQQRPLFYAIFGGKMLGLALCFAILFCASLYFAAPKARAQSPAPTVQAAPAPAAAPAAPAAVPDPAYVSPINTMWVLVTAFLVFFMQAGFMFLEAGF